MARRSLRALGRVGAIVEAPAFYENFSGYSNLACWRLSLAAQQETNRSYARSRWFAAAS